MIDCGEFSNALSASGIDFFTGVPDSLLKSFGSYIEDNIPASRHIIAANEGNALAIAAGHFLATGNVAAVYLQNSGLGNLVNPLASLNHPSVYGLPTLLIIGWRGEPGVSDEPQHRKQGEITPEVLRSLDVPFQILDSECSDIAGLVAESCKQMQNYGGPAAILVKKNTFSKYELASSGEGNEYAMKREEAIHTILQHIPDKARLVATTGMPGREVYDYREDNSQGHGQDFLTVGSMGHASSIALGMALSDKAAPVICLDGDGASLMHLGAIPIIGNREPRNFIHLLLNNGAHDSVGGQPTVGFQIDLCAIAKASGYKTSEMVDTRNGIETAIEKFFQTDGPHFLEIRVSKGNRPDLSRPKTSPSENRSEFMKRFGVNASFYG
jgi:phosphonopyruvate decarboxylase